MGGDARHDDGLARDPPNWPGRVQFRLFYRLENADDEELLKRGLGKPAIVVITRCSPRTGEVLHVRLRKGQAGSPRGVVRFTDELIARVARAGASGEKLLRADSSFWNKKLIARLQATGWLYSISVRKQFRVPQAIAQIPESAWRSIEDYPE